MKRSSLLQHLRKHGCILKREGAASNSPLLLHLRALISKLVAAPGNWRLETGNWQLAAGSGQLTAFAFVIDRT